MRLILGVVLLFVSGLAAAEQGCEAFSPEQPGDDFPVAFNEIFERSNETGVSLCRAFRASYAQEDFDIDVAFLVQNYTEFLRAVVADRLSGLGFRGFERLFDHFEHRVQSGPIRSKSLPDLELHARQPRFGFASLETPVWGFIGNDDACQASYQMDCRPLTRHLASAINPYKQHYKRITGQRTISELIDLSDSWDEFLNKGRALNLTSILATSSLEAKHLQRNYLVGPPARQWFFLQPSLVYGYAEQPPDGENTELGIAVEWFGVNWWNLSPVPLGISGASVFLDYQGVSDVGHGVMLHVDNRFSFGWANHGGDDTYYLSLDLLKLLQDKREQLGRLTKRMKQPDD